jgi:hypothetical protein
VTVRDREHRMVTLRVDADELVSLFDALGKAIRTGGKPGAPKLRIAQAAQANSEALDRAIVQDAAPKRGGPRCT